MALKYTTIHRKVHLLDWDLGRNLVNFTGSIDEDKKKEVKKKLKLWPVDPQASGVTQVRPHDRSKNGDGREAVELVGAHDMGELLSPIGS